MPSPDAAGTELPTPVRQWPRPCAQPTPPSGAWCRRDASELHPLIPPTRARFCSLSVMLNPAPRVLLFVAPGYCGGVAPGHPSRMCWAGARRPSRQLVPAAARRLTPGYDPRMPMPHPLTCQRATPACVPLPVLPVQAWAQRHRCPTPLFPRDWLPLLVAGARPWHLRAAARSFIFICSETHMAHPPATDTCFRRETAAQV
jgi:hypothetical protein